MTSTPISALLLAAAHQDQGLYPARTVHADGTQEERTPWQSGWNAACMDLTQRWVNMRNWWGTLTETEQDLINTLLAQGAIDLSLDEDKNVDILLVLNDTFSRATADAETVLMHHLPGLAEGWALYGQDALTAYAARQRKCEPLPSLQTEQFNQAKAWFDAVM